MTEHWGGMTDEEFNQGLMEASLEVLAQVPYGDPDAHSARSAELDRRLEFRP